MKRLEEKHKTRKAAMDIFSARETEQSVTKITIQNQDRKNWKQLVERAGKS